MPRNLLSFTSASALVLGGFTSTAFAAPVAYQLTGLVIDLDNSGSTQHLLPSTGIGDLATITIVYDVDFQSLSGEAFDPSDTEAINSIAQLSLTAGGETFEFVNGVTGIENSIETFDDDRGGRSDTVELRSTHESDAPRNEFSQLIPLNVADITLEYDPTTFSPDDDFGIQPDPLSLNSTADFFVWGEDGTRTRIFVEGFAAFGGLTSIPVPQDLVAQEIGERTPLALPIAVPTPSAAVLGLSMLAPIALRRRKQK